jgi:putative ABC transport system permease protein
MRTLLCRFVARLRHFVRPTAGDADFDQELESHLAMAVDDKVRGGVSADEARRQARAELGGVTQLREAARAARGLPWLETFWLDGKLGLRRLRRSWGLTLVGGLAMAVTIGLGASIITIWNTFAGTALPLDEGDRVVAIQVFDRGAQQVQAAPLADFRRWRETATSVEQVSAMRAGTPRIVTPDGAPGAVSAAEMTASGFRLARVRPILGRPLIDDDEREGAEPVAVINADLWRSGFASDPAVIGQRIQIDGVSHVVVGVMPEDFRFPVNQRLWTPLHVDALGPVDTGNGVFVFARLAPGATLERAQTEVRTLGVLSRPAAPHTAGSIEPRVVPYAAGFLPAVHANPWMSGVVFLLAALLLVPPSANIAILVYARTLARREEFAARTALGAGRGRIVIQVFIELLVLAAGAGIVGFLLAQQFSGRLASLFMPGMGPKNLPFWIDFTPSLATVIAVAAFSVLAAAIAGGVPAFHATGRWRRLGPSGLINHGGSARLGKTWTALLAAQVALALAILPSATEMLWGIVRPSITGPALPVQQFLTAPLGIEGESARFETVRREAVTRLRSEPGIAGVAVSTSSLMEEPGANIEVEGRPGSDEQVRFNVVDDRFFDVFGARFLAGRRFMAADFQPGSTAVIVNRSFVTEVLGEGNPLGRRVHYLDSAQTREPTPPPGSHEVVGVVDDFPGTDDGPIMFHPMTTSVQPVAVTIRAASDVGAAARALRRDLASLDPALRLGRLESLEDVYQQRRSLDWTFVAILGSVTLIVVLFSMAGVYTLMTFVVAQRWREIGVRSALGAQPRRLLTGIFGRALLPLLIGAGVGCVLAIAVNGMLPITEAGGRDIPGIVPLSAALMVAIGVLAAAGPARRAIQVDPTEALRVI